MKYLKVSEIVKSVSITHSYDQKKLYAVNTSDILEGSFLNPPLLPISELKGQFKKTIKKNDILFSEIRPANKRYAMVTMEDTEQYVVSTKLMVLRKFNDDVDLDYFYYWLTNEQTLRLLQSRAENRIGSFPQITFDLLSDYLVPIPELEDQKKIARALKIIDLKIVNNKKTNDVLLELAECYFDRWFLQYDFPSMDNKPYKSSGGSMVFNDQTKNSVPVGWKVICIKELCNLVWGQCPDGKNILPLNTGLKNTLLYCSGAGDMRNGIVVDCQARTNASRREAESGDILMSVAGSIGALCICDQHISLGRAAVAFRPNKKYLAFCYFVIKKFINRMMSVSTGSIQKVVNDSHIDDIVFAFNEDIVEKYSFANRIVERCMLLSKENKELLKMKADFLPLLMNGQVTVN